ncbi:MAG TPA: plastocyanin/azurin family copper-binding protein, partial [Daejeonella sp.]|nr:plastocyanin/azurin family copper-binding protein [Daejeonella sp.]
SCSSEKEKHIPRIHHVQIKNMKFEPAQLIVNKGDSIVWTNLDIVTHDVTEEKTKAWTSAPITMGKTWKMEAAKSADYFCSIHIVMKGKIIVE